MIGREIKGFKQTVWQFYKKNGRSTLPWRQEEQLSPYHIFVSEMMLQQTQVERVIPKYQSFIEKWPTVDTLAKSSLKEVLVAWQGLGYNRRAKYLHECARYISKELGGVFPRTTEGLCRLPGIGTYTAGAVMSFAFNQPVTFIETNIRTVYLHHFFPDQTGISDAEILPLITETLDHEQPREWYWALMDYGSYLKRTIGNQNQRSAEYKKQSRFKGSDREIRGAIIRTLSDGALSSSQLVRTLGTFPKARVVEQLSVLKQEGLIDTRLRRYQLAE